jgi:hypothetical protein
MTKLFRIAAGSVIATGLAFASAHAADHKYKATLNGASEVPANATTGKGMAELTLNDATKEISWKVTFEGLTGDAVAAHIHGPADKTANAGVVVSLGAPGAPLKSPVEGKATLTDAQIADLNAGKHYVNVHTAANKAGEIRGQIGK